MVTNGYITAEALDVLGPHIDAYRVDVKGFSDKLYHDLCHVKSYLPVLEAAVRAKTSTAATSRSSQCDPDMNDDEDSLRAIAEWIVAELGPQTPWHVTRFTRTSSSPIFRPRRSRLSSGPSTSATRRPHFVYVATCLTTPARTRTALVPPAGPAADRLRG